MIPISCNSYREEAVRQLVMDVQSGVKNLYLIFSKEDVTRDTDVTTGIVNANYLSVNNNSDFKAVYAINLKNAINFAIQRTNVDPQSFDYSIFINNIEYLVKKSNFDATKEEDHRNNLYWTNIYANVTLDSSTALLGNYNVVSIVENLRDDTNALVSAEEITTFTNIDFTKVTILVQARPRNTDFPAEAKEFPILISF